MNRLFLNQNQEPICALGLGLAALGRPGYINIGHATDLQGKRAVSALEKHTHVILDSAYKAGIRYFDAARSYGRAEAFLRNWLTTRGIQPEQVKIGSKWGYRYTANWQIDAEIHEVKEHSLSHLQKQWQESTDLLGDYLDLYQIHSATLKTKVMENTAVLNELANIKSAGTAVGFTVSGPDQAMTIHQALEVKLDGELLFDSVQATWNLLEKSAEGALTEAKEAGLFVIVKEALANGRLTARNQDMGFQKQRSLLDAEAKRLNTTLDALALAAVLAQPWVDVVLSGAAREDHLTMNLKALNIHWSDENDRRLSEIAEASDQYWKKRNTLSWN